MQTQFKLIIGCDLAAYDFKNRAIEALRARGYDVTDAGCWSAREGDYPQVAEEVATRVVAGEFHRGPDPGRGGQGRAALRNRPGHGHGGQ